MSRTGSLFDRLAGVWPDLYAEDRLFRHRSDLLVETILGHARPGDLLIDIGCGSLDVGQRLVERGIRVLGVDTSLPMLMAARPSSNGRPPVHRACADAAVLPLADGCSRYILCSSALEYLPEDGPALAEIRRLLAGGGRAWITLPRRGGLARRLGRATYLPRAFLRRLVSSDANPVDVHWLRQRYYDRRSIEATARENGLEVVEIRRFGLPHPLTRLPERLVRWLERRQSAGMMLLAVLEPAPRPPNDVAG